MAVDVFGYSRCVPTRAGREKLQEYRAKRDFAVTAEPAGADGARGAGGRFVVQRHRARRLHYDFRLEVDGVLASWAVPRGPSLDPAARQLAVHVEDHPLEYADFEGVIPRGQYGGGDVIVWDRGTWTPAHTDDPAAAIAAGELHFDLARREAGRPVRADPPQPARTGKEQWLLVHKNDEHAAARLDRRRPPALGAQRPHQRRGRGRPGRAVAERRAGGRGRGPAGRRRWEPPTDDELAALDALRRNGGRGRSAGRDVKLTNLDKVLFPGRGPASRPSPSASWSATTRRSRRCCCPTWPGGRSTCTATPTASTARASGSRSCPPARRTG